MVFEFSGVDFVFLDFWGFLAVFWQGLVEGDSAPIVEAPRVVFCWDSAAGVAGVVERERVRVVQGFAGAVVAGEERVVWCASPRVLLGWAGAEFVGSVVHVGGVSAAGVARVAGVVGRERVRVVQCLAGDVIAGGEIIIWGASSMVLLVWAGTELVGVAGGAPGGCAGGGGARGEEVG